MLKNCKKFRELLKSDCLMIPGCFNGLAARLAAQHGIFSLLKHTGFPALYISGAAVSASSGVPDIGYLI
jgi:methylisocitrate lyase